MRIKLQGFIVMDYRSEYGKAREQLAEWVTQGKIKSQETIVKGGLEAAEKALVGLFKGANTGESPDQVSPFDPLGLTALGKLLVEIKNPEDSPKL